MRGEISRSGWGAQPPRTAVSPLPWRVVDELYIHYTGAEVDLLPDYHARVRGIQHYHQHVVDPPNHWSDIAYNKVVSRTGLKFDGRGWQVQSAATFGRNHRSQAIVFLGDDTAGRDDVTDQGRRAISEYIVEALSQKKEADGGTLKVLPHSAAVSTACPGDELRAFIAAKGWEGYRKTGGYPPRFFKWLAWHEGEGDYKQFGPRKGPRPKGVPFPLTPVYWLARKRFLARRKK